MIKKVKQSTYSRMEDVDRSCVHAVIIIGLICAVSAYLLYPAGIWCIHFTGMTAGPVLRLAGSAILGIAAILIFIDVLHVFIKR